ncbi:hypothetical protein EAY64_19665 [Aquitalea palustris]|uniref:Uncharacterized protein n=1 Tax=Aquitalea palustris TaxID=2480983 RepID=A0A454JD77_9NEIS|nr:hypothetical protein [Aquitalea palustris]RMC91123.1 hypothetical protein EAY64_19665 [Aquitalea palustris]
MQNTQADASARDAEQAWRKAKQLEQALIELLQQALPASGLCTVGKPLTEQQKRGESRLALCCSLPLLQKKKRKDTIVAFLDFQISLAGDGVPLLESTAQPLGAVLHIAHWTCEFSFDYDAYVGFPATGWQPWLNQAGRLLRWEDDESPFGDEWTYSLRLDALSADEGLLRQVVLQPVLALLEGAPAEQALPDGLPGLIRYVDIPAADGLQDLRVTG